MTGFTTYGANAQLNGTAMPATLYAKPHVGDPGAAATANAAAETTRKAFTRTTSTARTCTNVAALLWEDVPATETWTHWSAWDAASGGNAWYTGLVAGVAVEDGGNANVPIGGLVMSIPAP